MFFVSCIKILGSFIENVTMRISEDGFYVKMMDSSLIVLVELQLNAKSAFKFLNGPKDLRISFHSKTLLEGLKNVKKGDIIQILFSDQIKFVL